MGKSVKAEFLDCIYGTTDTILIFHVDFSNATRILNPHI